MKNQAFTLIELLVVVLIIGILASIAVPQYQKAVDKSRYAAMVQLARAMGKAQESFYTANGYYATDWNQLDLDLPNRKSLPINSEGRLMVGPAGFLLDTIYLSAIYFDGDSRIASYTQYYPQEAYKNHGARCLSYASRKKRGNAICEGFGGKLEESYNCSDTGNGICNIYSLHAF